MSKFKRRRPSPALFISIIALFIALGSGAYAAAKIGTSDLKNGAVTTKKLEKKAVAPKNIKKYGVKANKIAKQAVGSTQIADLGVYPHNLLSPTLTAVIDGDTIPPTILDGGLDSETGAGATGVVRDALGRYTVTWSPQDPGPDGIAGCAVIATAGNVHEVRWAQTAIKGTGTVAAGQSSEVQIRDETGAAEDSKFSTALFC